MNGMGRVKATITLDRDKALLAQQLSGAASTSAAVDAALDCLIRVQQLRRDVAAYQRHPATDAEIAVALAGFHAHLDDDVDWDALYPEPG